jgi:predicted nucleotidyltransferase
MTHNARVDEATYLLYAAVAEAAKVHGIQWMVTGAGSRILLLENVYGLPRGKATEDVDFAVMVESWEHYQTIVAGICEDGRFTRDPGQRQRIRGPEQTYLDLIPFGGVETDARTIETVKVLFDHHYDAVEQADYDIDLAAAYVLGRHTNTFVSADTREQLLVLLEDELQMETDSRLVYEIAQALPGSGEDRSLLLLGQFQAGLLGE